MNFTAGEITAEYALKTDKEETTSFLYLLLSFSFISLTIIQSEITSEQ